MLWNAAYLCGIHKGKRGKPARSGKNLDFATTRFPHLVNSSRTDSPYSCMAIINFLKKHKITKKNHIDLSYASLSPKKRLKRKKEWLQYMEVNAKKDYNKQELRLKLHEEVA